MLSTIFIVIGAIIVVIVLGFLALIYSGPQLPKETDELIKEVLATPEEEQPELITGQTGYAKNGDVSIFYELINNENTTKGTVLLVNGLSQTLLDWQPYIYEPLMEAGYQVIRFDNRSVGMSDWMKDWTKETAYTLEDMAKDAIAVLDVLNIEKAHIVGMSMGGMISQRIAISHGERVLSLTSVMSSGYFYDPDTADVTRQFTNDMMRYFVRYRDLTKMENRLKLHLGVQRMLIGDGNYFFDDKAILEKAYYELTKRKAFNIKSQDHHGYAIKKSGSRYEELEQLNVPTLVIHGTHDPLILFEHGLKYASMMADATVLFINGMGHDFPRNHMPQIGQAIIDNFEKGYVN